MERVWIDDHTWEPIEHLDHAQEALDTWRSLQETRLPSKPIKGRTKLQYRECQLQQDSDDAATASAISSDDDVSRIVNASNVTVGDTSEHPTVTMTTGRLSRPVTGDCSVGIRRSARIVKK